LRVSVACQESELFHRGEDLMFDCNSWPNQLIHINSQGPGPNSR